MTVHRPRLSIHGASLATWAKTRPWRARIYYAGRERSLGYFATKEEARAAHADAARHLGIKLKSEGKPCASSSPSGKPLKILHGLASMLGGELFAVMRTLLIAAMGEPLTSGRDGDIHQGHRPHRNAGDAVEELWIIAGTASGKTRAIATLAAYLAGCCDHRDVPWSRRARRSTDHGCQHVTGRAML